MTKADGLAADLGLVKWRGPDEEYPDDWDFTPEDKEKIRRWWYRRKAETGASDEILMKEMAESIKKIGDED